MKSSSNSVRGSTLLSVVVLFFVGISCGEGQKVRSAKVASQPLEASPPIAYSTLWGRQGELWDTEDPDHRLSDFSFAGYRSGEYPIPDVLDRINVRSFGARGNGRTDDSAAFSKAIKAAKPGQAVFVPNGRYLIDDIIRVTNKGSWVLQGQSKERTILYIKRPGQEVWPQTDWRFKGAFLWIGRAADEERGERLARVTDSQARGTRLLDVSSSRFRPGDWIRLVQTDPGDGSLFRHLHTDDGALAEEYDGAPMLWFESRLTSVSGRRIELERPLPVDVQLRWQPEIREPRPSVTEVGIENLSIEFKHAIYGGHLNEAGYNALRFEDVSNCWVRNVDIINADRGIDLSQDTRFCTVTDVRIGVSRSRSSIESPAQHGHHALIVDAAADNLVTHFSVEVPFVHDLALTRFDRGNVYSNGHGEKLGMDHHRSGAHQNLFTNIDLGNPLRALKSGGSESRGPHSGAYNTFWNIRGAGKFDNVGCSFGGGRLNIVGFPTNSTCSALDWHTSEAHIDARTLRPPNIHEAQVRRRLGPPCFQGDDVIVVEAEDFDENVGVGASQWQFGVRTKGYRGDGYMETRNGSGTCYELPCVGRVGALRYRLNLQKGGTYRVLVRGFGRGHAADSLHVDLDGVESAGAGKMSGFLPHKRWVWSDEVWTGAHATVQVDGPGRHVLAVRVREEGFKLDKIVLKRIDRVITDKTPEPSLRRLGVTPAASVGEVFPAEAQATEDDGNVASNTLDGDLKTRWSAPSPGQSIEYDFGRVLSFKKVAIAWYRGDKRIATFDLLASIDGVHFDSVLRGRESLGRSNAHELHRLGAGAVGRYLRIVGRGNTENAWSSITSVRFFDRR